MKKLYFLLSAVLTFSSNYLNAQIFSPVSTTGYSLDAIAENTTAASTTGGSIDGSDYVLYSAAYGAIYSNSYGLPNTGLISSGTRTYQLQPYTANNLLYLTALNSGTLSLVTPAPYAGISLLGFATEGNATFNVTLRFTDNTTVVYSNLSFLDWFGTGTAIIAGFDRCGRTSGTPNNNGTNPKMYAVDLPLVCANRTKNLADIYVTSTATNARVCIAAVGGASAPTFSAGTSPVTCQGGTNGSASITASGGITPYTYTWSTTPVQTNSLASNLPTGIYTYSTQDNGGCVVTGTVTVTQSLAAQPNLTVASNAYTVCSGTSFTLGVAGAATYTWYSGSNSNILSPPIVTATTPTVVTYTVSGLTSANCLRTGSLNISVNPIPAASFGSSISPLCKTNPAIALAPYVQQTGGTFSGTGVVSGSFVPLNSGVGTFTITYSQTDANNCSNSATMAVQVSSLAAPAMSPAGPFCSNGAAAQITVNPTGGTFAGSGIGAGGLFTPSVAGAGSFPLSYSITSGPCTTTAGITVLVNAAPVVSVVSTKTFFCKNSTAVFLNGQPSGGTFTGPGMNGPAFTPANAPISSTNTVVYSYTDVNGCSGTASITLNVSTCAGISEVKGKAITLNIYPNPSTGKVFFSAPENTEVVIINELGQSIKEISLTESNVFSSELDLAPGIYFVKAINASGGGTSRLVITK